jgi:hypothetical protein
MFGGITMLYLIKALSIDSVLAGPLEQRVEYAEKQALPSLKILAEGERSKKLMGGTIAGRRGWAIIGDFPSNEEANKWAMSLPFWNAQTVDITPLVPFQGQVDSVTTLVQNMKSMLKK